MQASAQVGSLWQLRVASAACRGRNGYSTCHSWCGGHIGRRLLLGIQWLEARRQRRQRDASGSGTVEACQSDPSYVGSGQQQHACWQAPRLNTKPRVGRGCRLSVTNCAVFPFAGDAGSVLWGEQRAAKSGLSVAGRRADGAGVRPANHLPAQDARAAAPQKVRALPACACRIVVTLNSLNAGSGHLLQCGLRCDAFCTPWAYRVHRAAGMHAVAAVS